MSIVDHGGQEPRLKFLGTRDTGGLNGHVRAGHGLDTSTWHDGPSRRELHPRAGGRGEAFMAARAGDVGYECPHLLFRNTMVATLLGGRRDFARLDSGTASESSGMRLP